MKLTKTSNYNGFSITQPQDYIQNVDADLTNIFDAFKGRIRFGKIANGYRGENIEGEFRVFTATGSTASVAHTLGTQAIGFLLINKTGFGDLYLVSSDKATATFASSSTSNTYTVFLLK